MSLPNWAFDYPVEEERKNPSRYSKDYHRDSLPEDLYQLESATVDGNVSEVRRLLEEGVDMNAALDNNKMTSLMIACLMGNWDIIQMLVEEFEADLDGPLSRAGFRAIDYAGHQGYKFPNRHPICEYMKSKGSQHTWWGALVAGDFKRVKEYVENGQDIDEINPVLWNGNSVFIAHEFGNPRVAQWLIAKGGCQMIRNCHNIDTHDMKWSIGRGDAFFYRQNKIERPEAGFLDRWAPEKGPK